MRVFVVLRARVLLLLSLLDGFVRASFWTGRPSGMQRLSSVVPRAQRSPPQPPPPALLHSTAGCPPAAWAVVAAAAPPAQRPEALGSARR